MKTTSTSKKIKIGAFIAIGFAILFTLVFVVGNQRNLFTSTFNVSGTFKNVSGLKTGSLVRFAGINVGTVNDITIMNDTAVKITMKVKENVRKFIKQDAKLSIGSDGLMGDKLVTIVAGKNEMIVENNQELAVVNPIEMQDIIAKVQSITEGADVLVGNLAGISGKINSGQGSFGRLLSSDKLAKNLENTIEKTGSTVASINKAASGFADNMDAAKHSFLLRGAFKRKEKKRIQDSIAAVKAKAVQPKSKKKQ